MQTIDSEEIFGTHISDKGLVSRLYKEFPNSILRTTPPPQKKYGLKICTDTSQKKIYTW